MADLKNLLGTNNPVQSTGAARITPYNQQVIGSAISSQYQPAPYTAKDVQRSQFAAGIGEAIGSGLGSAIQKKMASIETNRKLKEMEPYLENVFGSSQKAKAFTDLYRNAPDMAAKVLDATFKEKETERKLALANANRDTIELNLIKSGVSQESAAAIANISAKDPNLGKKLLEDVLKNKPGEDTTAMYEQLTGQTEAQAPTVATQAQPQVSEQVQQPVVPTLPKPPTEFLPTGTEEVKPIAKALPSKKVPEVPVKEIAPVKVTKKELSKPITKSDYEEVRTSVPKTDFIKKELVSKKSFMDMAKEELPDVPKPDFKSLKTDADRKFAYESYRQAVKDNNTERHNRVKELREDYTEGNKVHAELRSEIVKQEGARRNDEIRLKRIKLLTEKGDTGPWVYNTLINTATKGIMGIGVNLTGALTTDAQEIEKLSNDFVKGAKDIYGSRLTNADLAQFMKTVPNLMQSPEGILRVIQNLQTFNEMKRVRYETMRDIVNENGGYSPIDLDIQIEERAGDKLDEIAAKFEKFPVNQESGSFKGYNLDTSVGKPIYDRVKGTYNIIKNFRKNT